MRCGAMELLQRIAEVLALKGGSRESGRDGERGIKRVRVKYIEEEKWERRRDGV